MEKNTEKLDLNDAEEKEESQVEGTCNREKATEGEEEVAELRRQLEEAHGKYLRLAADFDNFKKRTERQSTDMAVRANQALIAGLLPVLDNFSLALDSIEDTSVHTGVKMIYEQLMGFLKSEGLEEIPSLGSDFDPSIHEAVAYIQSSEHEENIIVEEIRKGYKLKGKIIRPGMVKVNIKKEE